MSLIFGLTLAFIFPLFFLRFIRWLDFYQTGQPKLILLSLIWGEIAFALAAFSNNFLLNSGLADQDAIIRIYAPIQEEIIKGLVLLYLIRLPKFTYSVDGAVYGFATGIGFAVVENFAYITDPATAAAGAWQRILTANLVHATSSTILGIALGIFHLKRSRSRWLIFVSGLFLAIGQHMFYNAISLNGPSLIVAFGTAFLGLIFIYLAMQHRKRQAQDWIRQKLGMDDRVTPGEVAMVNRLDSKQDVFYPVFQRFGAEKASQVEQLVYLQARIGIKRKTLDSFQKNDFLRNAVEAEMSKMRTEMDVVRRAIGVYAMLFVRGLYTEEMISVWDQMQAKIRERSVLNEGQKPGGLWSSLEERLKAPTDAERRE